MKDLVKNINSELVNSSGLLVQYKNIKLQNKDYIVFFRVGEFYETYFDDAIIVSQNCSIALTRKHFKFGDINLAGIPGYFSTVLLMRKYPAYPVLRDLGKLFQI